mgnify:CR=1 FL=1
MIFEKGEINGKRFVKLEQSDLMELFNTGFGAQLIGISCFFTSLSSNN